MALSEEQKRRIEEEEKARIQPSSNIQPYAQKHGMPALLSFFIPGLGQIIKGQVGKGILVFIGFFVGLFLFVIPAIVIWVWQIYDAYNN